MFTWSYNFVMHALGSDGFLTFSAFTGVCIACCNMLCQAFLNLCFGDKSVLKVGGKRGG